VISVPIFDLNESATCHLGARHHHAGDHLVVIAVNRIRLPGARACATPDPPWTTPRRKPVVAEVLADKIAASSCAAAGCAPHLGEDHMLVDVVGL
jgi:hypothetical protein